MLPLLAAIALAPADTITLKADLGFVNTSGNSEVTSVNAGNTLTLTGGAWGVTQAFGMIYGKTDGETSTSQYRASLRGERAIAARLELFVLTEFDRNTFAGVSSRYTQSAGVAIAVVEGERDQLDLELGAGYTWQNAVRSAPDREFSAGRAAARYRRALGEKAELVQLLEFLPNFKESEDRRINSETSLSAPIAAGIAMKASYVIRHDGLPEPGFEKTDRILTTGIQVTF